MTHKCVLCVLGRLRRFKPSAPTDGQDAAVLSIIPNDRITASIAIPVALLLIVTTLILEEAQAVRNALLFFAAIGVHGWCVVRWRALPRHGQRAVSQRRQRTVEAGCSGCKRGSTWPRVILLLGSGAVVAVGGSQ